MKYIKLFFISVVVFGVMLFCISLLFPSNTIVSRAVNIAINKSPRNILLSDLYRTAYSDSSSINSLKESDTLLVQTPFASHIQQGVAIYDTHSDSTAVQVFYKIHVPTYKFWDKFGLMLNETKYGPSLDSAIKKIEAKF